MPVRRSHARRKASGQRDPVAEWDGLCGHPSGLRTPAEMNWLANITLAAMSRDSAVADEDAAEACLPRRQSKMQWWRPY